MVDPLNNGEELYDKKININNVYKYFRFKYWPGCEYLCVFAFRPGSDRPTIHNERIQAITIWPLWVIKDSRNDHWRDLPLFLYSCPWSEAARVTSVGHNDEVSVAKRPRLRRWNDDVSAYDIPVGRLAWLPAGMSRPHTFTWKYATFEANGRDSTPFDHLARRH